MQQNLFRNFCLICSILIIALIQTTHSYPLTNQKREDDYYAAVTNSQFTLLSPTSTLKTFLSLPTYTLGIQSINGADGTENVQNKGIFSWIGKAFKAIFHIGESAASKAMKKALPILQKVQQAKALLPAQKYVSLLSKGQQIEMVKTTQLVINNNKNAFKALQNAGNIGFQGGQIGLGMTNKG